MAQSWSSNNTVFFFQVMRPVGYLLAVALVLDLLKLSPRHRR